MVRPDMARPKMVMARPKMVMGDRDGDGEPEAVMTRPRWGGRRQLCRGRADGQTGRAVERWTETGSAGIFYFRTGTFITLLVYHLICSGAPGVVNRFVA